MKTNYHKSCCFSFHTAFPFFHLLLTLPSSRSNLNRTKTQNISVFVLIYNKCSQKGFHMKLYISVHVSRTADFPLFQTEFLFSSCLGKPPTMLNTVCIKSAAITRAARAYTYWCKNINKYTSSTFTFIPST